jgi:uncharacterized damage-inducible protein DinB
LASLTEQVADRRETHQEALMPIALHVRELLEYTEWQRERWRTWFRVHPEMLHAGTGPHGDGRFTTIGDLVRHVFSAEQRYVDRLNGHPLTHPATMAIDDPDVLFAEGAAARRQLVELLDTFSTEHWSTPRAYTILTYRVTTPPKKIVVHVLIHEIRHWAQIATLCRLAGVAPEFHDFLASPVWGGDVIQA